MNESYCIAMYIWTICLSSGTIIQVGLGVQSWVTVHRGYLHPSPGSYPAGTESPGRRKDSRWADQLSAQCITLRPTQELSFGNWNSETSNKSEQLLNGGFKDILRHTFGWCSILYGACWNWRISRMIWEIWENKDRVIRKFQAGGISPGWWFIYHHLSKSGTFPPQSSNLKLLPVYRLGATCLYFKANAGKS